MEYCPFGSVLTPLLGFIKELKFKEKKDFQLNLWSSLLLKISICLLLIKIACQNARNGISDLLDFDIFLGGGGGALPPDPPRGSFPWHSLLPRPTFIFKPSTPKLIKNPALQSLKPNIIQITSFRNVISIKDIGLVLFCCVLASLNEGRILCGLVKNVLLYCSTVEPPVSDHP